MDLIVKVAVDDKASSQISKISGGIKSGLAGAARVGAAATAAVAAGTVAAGVGFVNAAKSVASYGDNVDKMSQKLGLSYEGFQKWDYVLSQAGVDINSMQTGLKTLTNKIDDAKNGSSEAQAMFAKLGISMDDLNNMSREEAFEAAIYGFQGMADSTERAALANDLFGKSGQNLTPLFNSSTEDTKKLMQAASDLGMVMSDEAVEASYKFTDSLDTLKRAMTGAKNNIMGEFLPSLTMVMDGFTQLIAGNKDKGIELITQGFTDTIAKFNEMLPQVLEMGGQILGSLVTAIAENLPTFIESLVGFIVTVADAIVQNIPLIVTALVECLPLLVEGGLQLFLGLVTALTEAMPTIIDGVVDAIVKIIELLPKYLPQMLAAAGTLFLAILTAIIEHLPEIVTGLINMLVELVQYVFDHGPEMLAAGAELIGQLLVAIGNALGGILGAIGDLIGRSIDAVGGAVGDMLQAGVDFIWGFIDGIGRAAGDVINAAVGAVSDAVDGVLSFLGIASPSKLMMTFGGFTMEGFAEGISDAADMAEKAMSDAAADVYGAADGTFDIAANAAYAGNQALPQIVIKDCEFNVRDDEDINRIADAIGKLMNRQMAGRFATAGSY